jgi:hypothetical protein
MLRSGALRRLSLGLVLAATAAAGTAGCVLAPFPEPIAFGPPVVVAPRPVIVAPPHRYYRGGYYGRGYYRGHGHYWR